MNEQHLDRLPPNNLEAEAACLGAAILDPSALDLLLEKVGEEDFYGGSHRLIFRACKTVSNANEPVDVVTVLGELRKTGMLEAAGGADALAGLGEKIASAANVESYIKLVTDASKLRRMLAVCGQGIQLVYAQKQDASVVIDTIENQVLEVGREHGTNASRPIDEMMQSAIKHIEAMGKRQGGMSGLGTGFTRLDDLTSGMQAGQMIVVAGRPGSGKTAFALNVACHVALREHKPVAIFSLEMTADELLLRLLSSEARVNGMDIRRGKLRPDDQTALSRAAAKFYSAKGRIFINDSADMTIQTLKASVRRLVKEKRVELVLVDYLQLLGADGRYENRVQEVTQISKALKAIAKEMRIPVMVASQLNRGVESRQGSKTESLPRLSDLRESGSIEQDADVVMLLHRKKKDPDDMSPDPDNSAKLIVAKQRSGPTDDIDLIFLGEFTRFENSVTPGFVAGGPATEGRKWAQ